MRTTITIDDALYQQALELSESSETKPSGLFQEALHTYIRVQAAKRLAALGGTAPTMQRIRRRRTHSSAS